VEPHVCRALAHCSPQLDRSTTERDSSTRKGNAASAGIGSTVMVLVIVARHSDLSVGSVMSSVGVVMRTSCTRPDGRGRRSLPARAVIAELLPSGDA
jgi:hypothetical protein